MIKKLFFAVFVCFFSNYLSCLNVHIIGDSHSFFCFNNSMSVHPYNETSSFKYSKNGLDISLPFNIHCFVSRTMYRIGRDGISGLNMRDLGVRDGDVAVFIFGEVDVRYHIGRQRDQRHRELTEVTDSLVATYFRTIKQNRENYKNVTCVVVSVVPPCNNGFSYEYPLHGSVEDRVSVTKALNNSMKNCCQENDIYFLDIYPLFALADGSLDMSLSDGIVHVNPEYNYWIKEKLVELIFA